METKSPRSDDLAELVERTGGLQPWRRLFHLVGGSCVAWTVYAMSPQSSATRWLVGSALALTFVVDSLRLRSEGLNRFFFRRCSALLSPREVEALSLTWFLLGVFAVLWFPGAMLPVMSILVLAVADPAAAVVGRLWGRRRLGTGTLEGSLAFFVAAAVVLIPFVGAWVALPVAAVVAAAEVAPTPVDDNAVIPVVAAACLWLLTGGL